MISGQNTSRNLANPKVSKGSLRHSVSFRFEKCERKGDSGIEQLGKSFQFFPDLTSQSVSATHSIARFGLINFKMQMQDLK